MADNSSQGSVVSGTRAASRVGVLRLVSSNPGTDRRDASRLGNEDARRRPHLGEIAARAGDLPALSEVATRVINMTRRGEKGALNLEAEILRDQALVTRVLKLANSAAYGVRGSIATVAHAVFILGFDTVRSLVLAACAESLYRRTQSGFKDRLLWEHALSAAFVSRLIAEHCAYRAKEEAFIAGLVHDVGKAVMDRNLRGAYEHVIARVYNAEANSFLAAEQELFGFDHTEVGFLVAKKWGLPRSIAEAVRYHHDPGQAEFDPPLCAIVSVANSVCVKLGIGPERQPALDLASLPATDQLTLPADLLDLLMVRALEHLGDEGQRRASPDPSPPARTN